MLAISAFAIVMGADSLKQMFSAPCLSGVVPDSFAAVCSPVREAESLAVMPANIPDSFAAVYFPVKETGGLAVMPGIVPAASSWACFPASEAGSLVPASCPPGCWAG